MMNSIFGLAIHFLKKAIDWYFRTKATPRYLMSTGLLLTAPSGIAWGVIASINIQDKPITATLTYGNASSTLSLLGLIVFIIGLFFELAAHRREIARENKRRIAVIEVRGLRGVTGSPLAEAVPKSIKGIKDPLLISLKPKDDGQIDPTAALREISTVVTSLQQREQGHDREDIVRVFGGLAPVPFLFLTGVMLDNEQSLKAILDWDRDRLKWRELDGLDDLHRFAPSNVRDLPDKTDEVILAVSASFQVDLDGAKKTVGNLPTVELNLEKRSTTSHWSEDKQIALAATFRDTVQVLVDKGVKKIHLFLAAPASLSFRFGTQFDKRMSPETIIYQYERKESPPFPWGISLPVEVKGEASVEFPNRKAGKRSE